MRLLLALVSCNRCISRYHCSKAHRELRWLFRAAVHLLLAYLQLVHKLLVSLLLYRFTTHQHFSQAFQQEPSISALSPHPQEITKLAVISVPLPRTFNLSDLPLPPCLCPPPPPPPPPPRPVSHRCSCLYVWGCQISSQHLLVLQLHPHYYPNPVCL